MSVRDLNAEAKKCFKAGNTKEAIKNYKQALKICETFNLLDEAASIHSNLAHLHLEIGMPEMAYKYADVSIRYSQDNFKASY